MANLRIRQEMFAANVKHYEVAKEIGISPYTLSVWLRYDLTGERLDRVTGAIEKLKAKRKIRNDCDQKRQYSKLL